MSLTEDKNDPCLRIIKDNGQQQCYLILSEKERKKGFVRPYRESYVHKTCGNITRMAKEISETYARNPGFYSGTFCCHCKKHFSLEEFIWQGTNEIVGS